MERILEYMCIVADWGRQFFNEPKMMCVNNFIAIYEKRRWGSSASMTAMFLIMNSEIWINDENGCAAAFFYFAIFLPDSNNQMQ